MADSILKAGDSIVIIAGVSRSLSNFRGPLIKALVDRGLIVHAIAPELLSNKKVCQQLRSWGVSVHEIPLSRAGTNFKEDVVTFLTLCRIFNKLRPKALLAYTIKPVVYGTLAGWLAGVPYRFALITGLGYAFTDSVSGKQALVQSVARLLYRQAIRRAQHVFFQNPDDRYLFQELGLLPEHVPCSVVNGSGVDLARFKAMPLFDEPPSFLLIARMLGDKGVREYVAAAAEIKKSYPNTVFRLVGDIDVNPNSIQVSELDEWVASGTIEYLGRVEDVRPIIARSSVYVLPSYREGTPRTVLEAMAVGRAIITTDAPGCRETVVDGYNGFIVPVKSVVGLVNAMRCFLDDKSLIDSMGARSRKMAEDKYDVHKVNAAMLLDMRVAQIVN